MASYLLPADTVFVPTSALAAALLTVAKPGRAQWRGAMPVELEALFRSLEQLADKPPVPTVAVVVTWITVKEAADLLGLSVRQTTALARRLGGRKVGKAWMLDAAAVLEEADARRSAADSGRKHDAVA
jgi:hypothetical protein